MAARAKRLIAACVSVCCLAAAPRPQRIVSLVPSLTETLFAIGAGPQVVGVGSFDSYPPGVNRLPRVGGLVDPDTERILALHPDLVVTYGSQTELEGVLKRAGIRTFPYRHGGVREELQAISELARVTAHQAEGMRVTAEIERRLAAVRSRVSGRPRPRTMLVIDRQPGTLRDVYVSGGRGFLHELLDIAGGADVFADVDRESVQPSTETLLARAPDVILELRATPPRDVRAALSVWSTLASVPAVQHGRVQMLTGDYLVEPGPRLGQAAEAMARAIHPEVFR